MFLMSMISAPPLATTWASSREMGLIKIFTERLHVIWGVSEPTLLLAAIHPPSSKEFTRCLRQVVLEGEQAMVAVLVKAQLQIRIAGAFHKLDALAVGDHLVLNAV